ncbi:MAG: ABC transporter ATP-binding protein [Defluviitaleaceae bacterium]|nr:ABC transporter ATP-binding protein [Defluviitaleaceae bacterium]
MPLKINNVSKTFRDKKIGDNVVIRGFSTEINEGEFVTLLGPSGCGKTTLLTMVGGFQSVDSGSIALDDKEIEGPSVERGYVFQNYALFPWMTVGRNITYSLRMQGMPKDQQEARLKELLEMAHLTGHEGKFPIQLSGGMQQRVAVLRALASRPRILLLDEPLGAVDFQMREILQNELASLVEKAGTTVMMVTHDVSEAVFLSDRVLVMQSGGGKLMDDVKIDLPRPRDRSSDQFKTYTNGLTDLLRKAFKYDKER